MAKRTGWIIVLLISLMPVFMLHFLGPGLKLDTYANATHVFGQISGLIGMNLFAITFILATRIRFIEDLFGGQDKVYIAHSVIGALSLVMILMHPIFLTLKFTPSRMEIAAKYLLPGGILSVDLGMIALAGMIILLMITLYMKMKYQHWKLSHKFLGVFFMFAVAHIVLVKDTVARDHIFYGYDVYAWIISGIGILAYGYTLFFKGKGNRFKYVVTDMQIYNGNVFDMTFQPVDRQMRYVSGQFAFLSFVGNMIGNEQHPFSIASSSDNPRLRIIVKNLGDYTSRLDRIKLGDNVNIEGPYGRFNIPRRDIRQVWIGGGIGITPFLGMAEDMSKKGYSEQVVLFYSVVKKEELILMDTFKAVEKKSQGKFRLIPWVTSERGYLNLQGIKKEVVLDGFEFSLCGPPAMKTSIRNDLLKENISPDKIHEEDFGFK